MNYLDFAFCIPLIWGAYKGFRKGLIIEVASIVALLLGVYGGIKFSDYMAEIIGNNFEVQTEYMPVVAFGVTFIIIVVVVFVIGKMVEKLVNLVALKMVNKIAGSAFGFIKVGLIISVLLVIINSYDEKAQVIPSDLKEGSLLYEPMSNIALTVMPALENSDLFQTVKEGAGELQNDINNEDVEEETTPE